MNDKPTCSYCGEPAHKGTCPRVTAIDYFEDGKVKRVEFATRAGSGAPIVRVRGGLPPDLQDRVAKRAAERAERLEVMRAQPLVPRPRPR